MDYSTEQELKKIWRALRCKANCGSVGSVIEITKAAFLTLVSNSSLQYPATYKITDIDNGLWIETLSNNTFELSATISLFVPEYAASGNNLGQMSAVTIPTVDTNEYVIWADHYWVNNTDTPVTPTIQDFYVLDGGLTKITKESGSIYITETYECLIDRELNVLEIISNTGSKWNITSLIANNGGNGAYIYNPISDGLVNASNLISVLNQKQTLIASINFIGGETITNNDAKMTAIKIEANSCSITGNLSSESGIIENIILVNFARFNNNILSGTTSDVSQIGYIELWDNCEMIGNEVTGNAAIWDLRTGENSKVNGNILTSPDDPLSTNVHALISDLDQMNSDEINDNVLSGYDTKILMVRQYGFSKLNNNTLSGDNTEIKYIKQTKSELTGLVLSNDDITVERVDMVNSILKNATNINIRDLNLKNAGTIDLTGFTTDIISETIESGKGWFSITHDFATTPVNAGSSVLYNIIPNGARVTNIKTFGTTTGGAGAELAFGIETDAPSLIASAVLATVNAGQTYNSVSTPATANRSLAITAAVGNVTGGEVTVLVEFVL